MKKRPMKWNQYKGWKQKKADWSKPYRPTAFDLKRDPSLAEKKEAFDWKGYRAFRSENTPLDTEDILYKIPGRIK